LEKAKEDLLPAKVNLGNGRVSGARHQFIKLFSFLANHLITG